MYDLNLKKISLLFIIYLSNGIKYKLLKLDLCFTRLNSNVVAFEFKKPAFDKCIKGSMCL